MKNLNELKKLRAAKLDSAQAIVDKAVSESRANTADEIREYDAAMKEAEELDATIKRAERSYSMTPGAPPVKPEGNPQGGEERKFNSLGEQIQCVVRAAQQGGYVDPRLRSMRVPAADGIEERVPTGLGELIPGDGGWFVQTDFQTGLLKSAYETGVLASRVTKLPLSTNANGTVILSLNETSRATGSRWGGVQTYWLEEAGTKTASRPAFKRIELKLKKLIGLCYATDELLQDAAQIESVVRNAFASELGFAIDDAIFRGPGAGTPLGILNAPCLVTQAAEGGQAIDTIVAENVEKMFARMPARLIGGAAWYINQNCWPQLFQLQHVIGVGGVPMFIPSAGLTQAPAGTLLGRPIVPIEQASTIGDVGDIVFANFSEYVMIDKGAPQSALSIHVRFLNDETVLRFVYRCDGQPAWVSAVTPYQSAGAGLDEQSPFVALAAR